MIFSGTVRSTDGSAVAGVWIDLWQSNGAGQYSHFDYQEPRYNLRGRLRTDANGRFEVKTVKPSPYEIPKNGPTEALLAILGSHAFRPAHLHMKLSHDGFEPMTTQLFIAGDPYIDSDCVKAVKPSLVIEPRPVTQGGVRHLVASYDFVLRPGAARRAA
jgi:catechol 1,2-dioxygenase